MPTNMWNYNNQGYSAIRGGSGTTNVMGYTNGPTGTTTIGLLMDMPTNMWNYNNQGYSAIRGGSGTTNVMGYTNGPTGTTTIGLQDL